MRRGVGKLLRELWGKGMIDKTWAIVKMRERGRKANTKSEVQNGSWWLIDVWWETSLKPADVTKKGKKLIEKKERTVIDRGILLWEDVWQQGGAIGELRAGMEGKRCLDVSSLGRPGFILLWLTVLQFSNNRNLKLSQPNYRKTKVFLFLIYASIFWSYWCWCKLNTYSLFSFFLLYVV